MAPSGPPAQFLVHPRTAELLCPLGYTKRGKPIWPVMGAQDPPEGDPPAGDPPKGDPPKETDPGYPAGTPVDQMTDKQQAAYYKRHMRKKEDQLKELGDIDTLKSKASQFDALSEASRTEQDRAVEAAKAEARKEAQLAAAPRLVRAEFRAQAAGRLSDEQIKELTDDLDLSKFLDASGDVDEDKVARKVNALAPKTDTPKGRPDMGQGARGSSSKLTGREQGLAEAEKRGFVKSKTAN